MFFKYIRLNIIFFVITYFFLCAAIFLISYKFVLNDFIVLENKQNQSDINTFLSSLDENIGNLKNITNDYSTWDDTYEFAKKRNTSYIYENFREGSQTLVGLNLDAIIYINLKDEILFSTYNNEYLKSNQIDFEKYLLTKFKDKNNVNEIINYNSNFIYLSKSEILKSDHTGDVRGFVLTIKLNNNEILNKNYSIFKNISINNNYIKTDEQTLDLKYLKAKISTQLDSNYLINNIHFFNNDVYTISLITTTERHLVNDSKKTIYSFNIVIFLIIFLIFFFIYKNQHLINNQNILLNKEVEKRTSQLNKAYRNLDEKNKELYKNANIDYLTGIKNRRSFFNETTNLLEESILKNSNFYILMIDIDNFKKINDTFGHALGDKVLINFCNIVNEIINKDDLFARIGGEEFCITFCDKKLSDITKTCENIRLACSKSEINIANQKITFTVSMGLSSRNYFNKIDKILHHADESLYVAKTSGKNCLVIENKKV